MRLWHSVLISLSFHAFLLCIPVAMSVTREPPPPREELQFVIVQGGGAQKSQNSVEPESAGPSGSVQPPTPPVADPHAQETPPLEPLSEPPDLHEEIEDVPQVEPPPPIRKAPPVPVVVEKKVLPKPPKRKVVEKPPKPKTRVSLQKESPKLQPRTPVIEKVSSPAVQPALEKADSRPGQSENPGIGKADRPSAHALAKGKSEGHGPVEASFGSGDGPRFIRKALPEYPGFARKLGKEGTVLLRLTINEQGRLVNVEVVKGAGSGLDEAAVRAAKKSTFSPARKNGKPVICKAHLPIRFVLRSSTND